jgi:hypothetical protein
MRRILPLIAILIVSYRLAGHNWECPLRIVWSTSESCAQVVVLVAFDRHAISGITTLGQLLTGLSELHLRALGLHMRQANAHAR